MTATCGWRSRRLKTLLLPATPSLRAGWLDEQPVKRPPMRRSALLAIERLRSKPFTHVVVAGARHELRGGAHACAGVRARTNHFRRTSYIGGALPGASRRENAV